VIAVLGMVGLSACAGDAGPGRADVSNRPDGPQTSVATTTASVLLCTASSVRATAESFFADYNAGEPDLIDRYIAASPPFQWYSDPRGRLQHEAYVRTTLGSFFSARRAEGDRLIVDEIRYQEGPNFHGRLLRSSREDPTQSVPFKGAIDCATGRIMVLSIAGSA
jgi:hypothetical protein